ncbi:MAG: hypothetical protein K2G87_12065, partial [Oscillospiraceae bacterium]|nr:hypothetical protein [Oscillospiraceae bacterium]
MDILISVLFSAYPLVMTGLNIANFFKKKRSLEITLDIFGTYSGLVMVMLAFDLGAGIWGITSYDYDKAIIFGQLHSPLHSKYGVLVIVIII